jgi:hypothetical protein
MALEDKQSKYGPFNKKGQIGTGEVRDTFANEGTAGLSDARSKYGAKEKNGTPEKSMIDLNA